MTKATYTQPASVETYVKSATHNLLGASGLKLRFTRSCALVAAGSGIVVRFTGAAAGALQAKSCHQPLDRAAGHVEPFAA